MVGRRTLLAALGAAAIVTGFLAGVATAPRNRAPASTAAAPVPSGAVAGTPTTAPSGTATVAATPPPAPAPVAGATPDGAVADFYRLVQQHQFDAAVRLWSQRMQASYPPGENVYRRFADTTSMNLQQDQVTQTGNATAVVAIDLIEVRAGQTYRWVGSWYLVLQSTWLLDQPALRPG